MNYCTECGKPTDNGLVCKDCMINNSPWLLAMKINENDLEQKIAKLKAENAELRARLNKAVGLPCKLGDVVYFIPTYNRKPIWGVRKGIIQMIGITRRGIHVKIKGESNFGKTYMIGKSAFLDKSKAEARLAELKGGEK